MASAPRAHADLENAGLGIRLGRDIEVVQKPVSGAGPDDPYDLARFVDAQASDYDRAISEIRNGRKETHWMWYVFPQFDGLGFSRTSKHYAIRSVAEAEAYLRHPILGPRLRESAEATLALEGRTAVEIFGSPDDMKLQSSATLFAAISPPDSVFERLLNKCFGGARDRRTLDLLGRGAA